MATKKKKEKKKIPTVNPLALAVQQGAKAAGELKKQRAKTEAKRTVRAASSPISFAVKTAADAGKKASKATKAKAEKASQKKSQLKAAIRTNYLAKQGKFARPNPLTLAKANAYSGMTVRDQVNIAKAVGTPPNQEKARKLRKTTRDRMQAQKKARESVRLSRYDKSLPAGSREMVQDAKLDWEKANRTGDEAGKAAAHAKAERVRAWAGYSGGADGSEKISPELTAADRRNLNKAGQKALAKAKLDWEAADKAGDEAAKEAAVKRGQEIRKAKGYQTISPGLEYTDAHGRTVEYTSPEEKEKWKGQTAAGLKAAGTGAIGSLLSLRETANQALHNYTKDRWGRSSLQNVANRESSIEAMIKLLERGEGNPEWGTVENLRKLLDASKSARKVLESSRYVDPNLPGQRLMGKSREYTEEALQGKTGLDKLLAQAGISMVQNAPSIGLSLIPVVGPAAGAGLLGAQAAGSKAYDLTERGIAPGEALGRGLVSGGIEALTERIPLGSLARIIRGEGGKSLLKNIARQAGIEATEESAAYIGNFIADKAAQDPEARWSLEELANAAAVGAISGAGFGGIGSGINAAVTARARSQGRTSNPLLDTVRGARNAQDSVEATPDESTSPTQETGDMASLLERERVYADKVNDFFQRLDRATPEQQEQMVGELNALVQEERDIQAERARIYRQEAETAQPQPSDRITAEPQDIIADSEDLSDAPLPQIGTTSESPRVLGDAAPRDSLDPGVQETQAEGIPDEGRIITEDDEVHSVGAAPRGFDPYTRAANEYGTIEPGENPARIIDVPRSTDGTNRVRSFARTALEAEITNPETIQRIEQDIIDGGFSYQVRRDKDALQRGAKTIETKGVEGALQQWQDVVDGNRLASKDDMVLAQMLYVNAERTGDSNLAAQLAAQIAAEGTIAGQAVQAMRLLKQATPEGRVYYMRKIVGKLNEDLAKKVPAQKQRDRESGLSESDVSKIVTDLQTERDDAIRVIQNTIEEFRGKEETAGETLGWVENLGKDLSALAVRRNGSERITPIYQIMLRDLGSFMNQYIDRSPSNRKSRTPADKLKDYFLNKEEYTRAWKSAKNRLLEKYQDNPDVLGQIQEFLSSDIIGPNSKLMTQAVVSSVLDQDISTRNLIVRSSLDRNALVSEIASDLIRKTNAAGVDAQTITGAVENYIDSKLEAQSRSASDYVASGIRASMRDIGVRISQILREGNAAREHLSYQISNMLIQEYGISESAALDAADAIQAQFYEIIQEGARKRLNAMFRDRPTPARQAVQSKIGELIKLGAFSDPNFKKLASEKLFNTNKVEISPDLIQRYMDARTDAEQSAALNAIYDDVANQVPPTGWDRYNAWRYFAMLGNPRTHIRNCLGNAVFGLVRLGRNEISAGIQSGTAEFARLFGKDFQRTRAVKSTKAAKEFAKQDYLAMQDILSGNKYSSDMDEIRRRVQERSLGPFSFLAKKNSHWLSKEDNFFKKREYIRSLASYITAHGWDPANLTNTQLETARTHAINDALEATFQEASQVASAIARFEQTNALTRVAVGGALPFKGVPINIAKQGFRYSPAGLVKSVADGLTKVRRGEMTATQMIDNISSGLTGLGIAFLGGWLFSTGLLNAGAGDDDKENLLDMANGSQNYSLNIFGRSYTIDWAAPSVLPLFIGAEFEKMREELAGEAGDEDRADQLFGQGLQALGRMFEPMLNMTLLSGVSSTIQSATYSQGNPLTAVGGNLVQNFGGQVIPTLLGQIARTVDPIRRSTYTDKDSGIPTSIQRFIQTQQNKIPGLSQRNVPYLNVWGEETVNENPLIRALQNFVSPGYIARRTEENISDELKRLDSLGYEGVMPSMVQKGEEVDLDKDGTPERLTREQWETWQKSKGQTAKSLLDNLMASQEYQSMSDDEKAENVSRIIKYAGAIGKLDAGGSEEGVDKWVLNARKYAQDYGEGSPQTFFDAYNKSRAIDKEDYSKGIKQGMFEDYVNSSDNSQDEKNYLLDTIKFFNMNPASSSGYHKAKAAGYTDPADISSVLESKSSFNEDGENDLKNAEYYAWICSLTDDPQRREELWQDFKPGNRDYNFATLASKVNGGGGGGKKKKKSGGKKSSKKGRPVIPANVSISN